MVNLYAVDFNWILYSKIKLSSSNWTNYQLETEQIINSQLKFHPISLSHLIYNINSSVCQDIIEKDVLNVVIANGKVFIKNVLHNNNCLMEKQE